ncbi:MAG: hypothetical protein R3E32_06835 [Chitinophagales bacterium]
MNAKIEFRKARTFTEVISISAVFVRKNFTGLFKSVMLIALPFMLIALAINVLLTVAIFPSNLSNNLLLQSIDRTANFVFLIFVYLVLFGLSVMVFFGVVYSYILLYIRYPDASKITVRAVYRKVFHDIWLYAVTTIMLVVIMIVLYFCSILLGTIHFLMGGIAFCSLIYMSVSLSFIFMVRLVERRGFIGGFYRSLYLIREYWWQTFSIYMVTSFISFSLISLPGFFLAFSIQFISLFDSGIYIYAIVMQTIFFAFYFFIFATNLIVTAFQYFALVERKEGIGLIQRIERIGAEF